MRVLLVDDEPGVLRALERLFRRRGHEVRTAPNGMVALGLLDEFPPDAVVSDFLMDGMTGVELLRRIAVRFPETRRVLLSGFAEVAGPIDATFLRKPYDAQTLLQACE